MVLEINQSFLNYVMQKFSETLYSAADGNKYFHIIPTQQMKGLNKHLVDEIHLNQAGCKRVTGAIMDKLDEIRKLGMIAPRPRGN